MIRGRGRPIIRGIRRLSTRIVPVMRLALIISLRRRRIETGQERIVGSEGVAFPDSDVANQCVHTPQAPWSIEFAALTGSVRSAGSTRRRRTRQGADDAENIASSLSPSISVRPRPGSHRQQPPADYTLRRSLEPILSIQPSPGSFPCRARNSIRTVVRLTTTLADISEWLRASSPPDMKPTVRTNGPSPMRRRFIDAQLRGIVGIELHGRNGKAKLNQNRSPEAAGLDNG